VHYAKTLIDWQSRFSANRDKISKLFDERFCQSEAAFLHGDQFVFQMQISKRCSVVPICRDYITRRERAQGIGNILPPPTGSVSKGGMRL